MQPVNQRPVSSYTETTVVGIKLKVRQKLVIKTSAPADIVIMLY